MPPRDFEPPSSVPSSDPLTRAGLVLGTPAYMAPEQARGDVDAVGAKSDVYALGAILYELSAGKPPYAPGESRDVLRNVVESPPTPLAQLRPDLPADFVALVERAMERDPARRLASARLLGEEVEAFRRGLDLRVYEYGAVEQIRRIVRRNRVASLALGAALLALVAGLVASILFARSADDARELAVAETGRTRAALERAEGQRLAAVSSSHAEKDPSLALLLGIEAAKRAPGLESASALHSALDRLLERRELRGHEGYVYDVAFSADGSRVASLAEDGTARVWDARTGEETARIVVRRASTVTFAPRGDALATIDGDGSVRLWSAADGAAVATLALESAIAESARRDVGSPTSGSATQLTFDASGERVAVFTTGGFAAVYSSRTGELVAQLSREVPAEPSAVPASVAFSPEGTHVLHGRSPRIRELARTDHSAQVDDGILGGHRSGVHAVAWSADGTRIACAESKRIVVRDARTRAVVRELEGLELDAAEPSQIVLSRRGDRLLQNRTTRSYVHGPWRAFDVDSGRIVAEGRGSCRAALDPEGLRIAAIDTEEENIALIDARTGERITSTRGHRYGVTRVAFAPDGRSIVTASRDRLVRVFAIEPGWPKDTWSGLVGREIFAFDGPSGRAIVRVGPESAVFVDARSGVELGQVFPLGAAAIAVDFEAKRARLCALAHREQDPTLPPAGTGVYDLERGELLYELPIEANGVLLADRDRDVMSLQGTISERDPRTGAEIRAVPFEGRLLAASLDGREFIAWRTASPNVIERVDRDTGVIRGRLEGHRGLVIDAEYSPDGTRLVTAAADSTARVWDLALGKAVRTLRWPAIETLRADFDPSGKRILVRSGREVRVFWADDERELVALTFAKSVAQSAVGAPIVARLAGFAPDDDYVAMCEPDGRVRLSPIDPLPLAMSVAPRELEPNELTRFQIGSEDERRVATRAFYERRPSASYEVGLARAALAEGDLDEAARRVDRAVLELPSFAPYHVLRSVIRARRAFAIRPEDPEHALRVTATFEALAAARAAGAEPLEFSSETELAPLATDPRWEALFAPRR